MAIAPTGTIYKSLSFDNVSSRNYGVYITGKAVYNAPERDVEMITIPGRNGAFALDNGRFQNIEVTYPAGIFTENETDFAAAVSDFRNFLCSKKGYCRLTDEYNPNEFRMAVYKSGLEVEPAQLRAGEFEITFECKPQRFLTSGETAVAVTNGGTITNPTLFPSSPMLEVKGYGKVSFNNFDIVLHSQTLGRVLLWDMKRWYLNAPSGTGTKAFTFETEKLASGDPLYYGNDNFNSLAQNIARFSTITGYRFARNQSQSTETGTMPTASSSGSFNIFSTQETAGILIVPGQITFSYGTSASYSDSVRITGKVENISTGVLYNFEIGYDLTIAYNGSNKITLTMTESIISDAASAVVLGYDGYNFIYGINQLEANSSVSTLGNPTYIDCDIGEAYMEKNGEIVSLNSSVDIGAELPRLMSGSNTITFDNTVTQLKIVPRWWKV